MFSFKLGTELNRSFLSYAECTVYAVYSLCIIMYICVYTDTSYACICMCMCICICVCINKTLQTLSDETKPPQDVTVLFYSRKF